MLAGSSSTGPPSFLVPEATRSAQLIPNNICSTKKRWFDVGSCPSYLSSQSSFFDLGDVGVCRVQLVKIHRVELVVEPLPKLPGQVVVAGNSKAMKHQSSQPLVFAHR